MEKGMFYVSKKMEISACHFLRLNYKSKCENVHGHNWLVEVFCKSKTLNENGMVVDFADIKSKVHGYLDHGNLNELLPFNPTAENIAKWIVENVPQCYKAIVCETSGNTATYIKEE